MQKRTKVKARNISCLDAYIWVALLLFLLAVVLSTYNLAYSPRPWFDEGWYLQIPKNLVLHGEYAPLSSEGFRVHDTIVGVSPLFYLPVAAVFKIWGVGLIQARAVIVVYFLVTCLLICAVGRKLYGPRAAVVAMALFILAQPDDTFTSAMLMGRQVMAEIPALCFLMAGVYAWLKAFDGHKNSFLILSGLFLGLAMKTKGQFLILVPSAFVALGVVDRLYYKERRYRHFVLPLATSAITLALQYLLVLFILGKETFATYLRGVAAASGPQVCLFLNPQAMQTAFKVLLRTELFVWVAAGLAYTALLALRKDREAIKQCFPWVFVAGWLTWFVFASVGWARYLLPAFAVSYLFVGKFLDDLAQFSSESLKRAVLALREGEGASLAKSIAVLLLVVLLLLNSSREVMKEIFRAPDDNAYQMAAYIDTHIEEEAVIETWEWEIAFLTHGQTYHHPPTELLNVLIAHANLGMPYDPRGYKFQQYTPTYILVGLFAKWTGSYPADFLDQHCTLVTSVGWYDLYEINAHTAQP